MTREEFTRILAYVAAAIGKPLAEDRDEADARAEVYWDLLGDLQADVLRIAAKRAVLEHPWASFPTPAELRGAAAETMLGEVKALSAGEAWGLAWRAACQIDTEQDLSVARGILRLPPIVIEAMVLYGIPALCAAKPDVARAHFMKIFDGVASRHRRYALLPAPLKDDIAAVGANCMLLHKEAAKALEFIGTIPAEAS